MRKSFRRPFVLVALAVGAAMMTGATLARTSAPAAETAAPAVVVAVANMRRVALTQRDATSTGGAPAKRIVSYLTPGKKATVKVAYGKFCVFDLHGAKINLVD